MGESFKEGSGAEYLVPMAQNIAEKWAGEKGPKAIIGVRNEDGKDLITINKIDDSIGPGNMGEFITLSQFPFTPGISEEDFKEQLTSALEQTFNYDPDAPQGASESEPLANAA
jgi:hypothetical protein